MIADHPDVAEVAVAEVAGAAVSVVTAFVVLREGAAADATTLAAHAATRLADYKRPRAWVFLEELPRTASGKVLRRALRG